MCLQRLPLRLPGDVTPLGSSLTLTFVLRPKKSHSPNDDASEKPCWPPHQNCLPPPDPLTLASCSGMVSQNIVCILVSCVNFQRTRVRLLSEEGINVRNWTESRRQMLKHPIQTCPLLPSRLNLPPPQPSPADFYPGEDKVLISWADRNPPSKKYKGPERRYQRIREMGCSISQL